MNQSERLRMQGVIGRHNIPQYHQYPPRTQPRRRRLKIIYELPKVVFVRNYTRILIPHVNPDEYRRQYNKALLDTTTLLQWCRRLNIPDSLISPPRIHRRK